MTPGLFIKLPNHLPFTWLESVCLAQNSVGMREAIQDKLMGEVFLIVVGTENSVWIFASINTD